MEGIIILDIFYLSQSYFDLPKRTIQNISNKTFLFNRPFKNMEFILVERVVDMIWVMVNSKSYVASVGNMNRIIYVLIDLRREIREVFVFVLKAKTPTLNVLRRQRFFN